MNASLQTFRAKLRLVWNSYRMLGLRETTKEAIVLALDVPMAEDFDARHGVSTADIAPPDDAGIEEGTARSNAAWYVPTPERVLRFILANVDLAPETSSFVDLGCGKGRTLLIASELAFSSVIGVELSPMHVAVANENVDTFRRRNARRMKCNDVRAICGDVRTFSPPDTDLLVYMYNPFWGEVMSATLDNLVAFRRRTGRAVRIVYTAPTQRPIFETRKDLRRLSEYRVMCDEYSWTLWEVQP